MIGHSNLLAGVAGSQQRRRPQYVAQGGGGFTVPTYQQATSPLTWAQVANTRVDLNGGDLGVFAYCGAAPRASTSEIYIGPGGGHFDGDNNIVLKVTMGANTPVMSTVCAESLAGAKLQNVAFNSDGKAAARHSYGDMIVSESRNRLMSMGCAVPVYNTPTPYLNDVQGMNLATGVWDADGTYSNTAYADGVSNVEDCTCQDTAGNIYVWTPATNVLLRMDVGSSTLATTSATTNFGVAKVPIMCDTTRNLVIAAASTGRYKYDIGSSLARTALTITGAQASHFSEGHCWFYCPDRDSFLGMEFNNTGTVYEATWTNATTLNVTTLSIAGSAPDTSSLGGYGQLFAGRFGYLPAIKTVYCITWAQANIHWFRLP